MEIWTCKQNNKAFCIESKFVRNTRDVSDNGVLTSTRRLSCPHHWRSCPFCLGFTPDGNLVSFKPEKGRPQMDEKADES